MQRRLNKVSSTLPKWLCSCLCTVHVACRGGYTLPSTCLPPLDKLETKGGTLLAGKQECFHQNYFEREVRVANLATQHSMTSVRDHWHLSKYPLLWSLLAYVGPMASNLTESPLHSGRQAAHSVGMPLAQTPLWPQTCLLAPGKPGRLQDQLNRGRGTSTRYSPRS